MDTGDKKNKQTDLMLIPDLPKKEPELLTVEREQHQIKHRNNSVTGSSTYMYAGDERLARDYVSYIPLPSANSKQKYGYMTHTAVWIPHT